ncbi:hypothetical protein Pint_05030 [Pistacia integerrima]|uniref:Uncharacterized protein n=1 Tax=Pistacia integerrima TaxID=434235 RepID=A0ACC0Z686_9ROSI|nr:hypothetical protein Pint_05030 [Pistacia integerrima]
MMRLTKRHGHYLFNFNSIVKDFMEEYQNLEFMHDRVQQDVECATRNTEMIEKDVQNWLKDVSQVVNDIQKLKEEIEGKKTILGGWCPKWNLRYRLSRKVEEKRSIMSNLRESGKFDKVSYPITLPGIEFSAPKEFQLFKSTEPVFYQIIEALKDDEIHIIGLYGMGGAGKTTLAKAVGKKVKDEEIFDEVLTIVVSQASNFKSIQSDLAESLGMKLEEEGEEARAKRLYLRFMETKKKILIILDDVWKNFDLKSKIGLPFGNDLKGCKILLTTRRKNVCIGMRCQQRIPLNELDEGEGLSLLKKHAGIDDEFHPLNDVAIKVAKECKGLPLAIVTIGSALKEKGIDEWKLVFEKLKKSKLVDMCKDIDVDEDVYAILKVSYDYLEGKETKLCFLLCSLFPEDYEIPLEELAKCGMGLGLFSYADSIEQARSQLRVIVNKLKASCLLIDASDEELVKMHDVVRDVALGIASKGENSFMVKAGLGLTEWPKEEKHLEQYTAISLMANKLLVLPDHVVCPKLETLLLSQQYCHYRDYNIEVSNHFFQEMKALKNLTLSYVNLSSKSLKFLTGLKFLELIDCNLRDISSLKHLIRLEILSLRNSLFDEFPKELGALTELRLLDLRTFCQLKKLSSNVIQRFSQLEELYVGDCFDKWEDERTRVKGSNASLSEFKSLSKLVVLFLETNTKCLPKDFGFVCNKLLRYDISVNTYTDCHVSESRKKALTIKDIEAPSLITFKALSPTLEYLCLKEVTGCENILPSIDKGGLNKLNSLVLEDCKDLKCIIDTFQMQVPTPTFSNLVKLSLTRLNLLREICCGPCGKLQSLTNFKVRECKSLTCLFTLSLARSLVQLKSLELSDCESLKHLFMREEVDNDRGKEILSESNHVAIVLPNLEKLSIEKLPQLRCIWKGPTYHVNLKNLIDVKVRECKSLTYLFTLSHVRSLVQLKSLEVRGCENLEHLVITEEGDNVEGEDMQSNYDHYIQCTFLANLESLQINSCERLEYIFPISVARVLVKLQMLTIENAPQLKQVFFGDHGREEGDGKEIAVIEFAQLKVLKLYGLANIIRFCPENYHSSWPALEDFKMDRCSYLSTSFIAEVVAKVRNQEEVFC